MSFFEEDIVNRILCYLDPISLSLLSEVSKTNKLSLLSNGKNLKLLIFLDDKFWKKFYEEIIKNDLCDQREMKLNTFKQYYIFQFLTIKRKTLLLELKQKKIPNTKNLSFEVLNNKDTFFAVVKDTLKIVSVGDNRIGKTSSIYKLFNDHFPPNLTKIGREEGVYETYIVFQSKKIKVQIIDTSASRDEYDEMRPLIYPNMDIFLVFFAIDKATSFINVINKWVPEIEKKVKDPLKILVGTDCDLRDTNRQDLITEEEGKELCKSLNFSFYIEISSKIDETLKDLFDYTIKCAYYAGEKKKRSWLGNLLNTDFI